MAVHAEESNEGKAARVLGCHYPNQGDMIVRMHMWYWPSIEKLVVFASLLNLV